MATSLLTRAEVTELLADRGVTVTPSTWSAYVSRGQAPPADEHVGSTPRWRRRTVLAYLARRPGRGARTDLR